MRWEKYTKHDSNIVFFLSRKRKLDRSDKKIWNAEKFVKINQISDLTL